MEMTRRSFLKGMAATAMGAAVSGIVNTSEAKAEGAVYDWAEAADVVIVGGGGAGFCAAIEAGKAGASVLIVEKAGFCGGNTALSGGMLLAAGTPEQKELAGYDPTGDAELFAEQQIRYAMGYADDDMIREMCLQSADAIEFMKAQGRVYKQVDVVPPIWAFDDDTTWGPRSHWDNQNQTGHFSLLAATVAKMDNVHTLTGTEVTDLITNESGEVIGIKTKKGDFIRANKGVILSCGSFDMNMEMSQSFNQMNYWAQKIIRKTSANTGRSGQCVTNTGDGIRMAQKIGAALKLSDANCMADRQYMGGVGTGVYNTWAGIEHKNPYNSTSIKGIIMVNSNGLRFVQEDADWGYVVQEGYKETRRINGLPEDDAKVWAIVDSVNLMKCAISMGNVFGTDPYAAMVKSADTIEELAEMAGIKAEQLKETVDRWNGFCAAESDPDYDRRTDFGTIEQGPFYALPFVPNAMGSFGGVRTNIDTQVISVDGSIIPRLYAAGTTMSGMYTGPFYPGCGYSVLGTVHWGRKAGKTVVNETAWATDAVASRLLAENEEAVEGTGNYNPGTYDATAKGMNGDVTVQVMFSETAIMGIQVKAHNETAGIGDQAVEQLPNKIVLKQSVEVDDISGATITSKAIKEAVAACIAKASK